MIKRVGNKDGKSPTYLDVSICERWLSYDNFFEDMSETWKPGLCIDKDIIKPGNRVYCPEYCKWVSRSENSKEMYTRVGNPLSNPEISKKVAISNYKKVRCIETGIIFDACILAEEKYHTKKFAVSQAANPNHPRKTAGGYHWEYIK